MKPGGQTYREWFDANVSDLGAAGVESQKRFTAAHVRSAIETASYAEASDVERCRGHGSTHLIDILIQPFKSYQEMFRSLVRQIAVLAIYSKLSAG